MSKSKQMTSSYLIYLEKDLDGQSILIKRSIRLNYSLEVLIDNLKYI